MHLTALRIGSHHVVAPRPVVPDTPVLLAEGGVAFSGVWTRVVLPYEHVALCTPYGTFLSCQTDPGGVPRLTLAAELGPREAFEEVLWPDGSVSLRTYERTYVTAPENPSKPLRADAEEADQTTRLRYAAVPGSIADEVAAVQAGTPRVADMPRQFAQPLEELPLQRERSE